MKLLVTGGCGFIGTNFVKMALGAPGLEGIGAVTRLINLDVLTYAGNPENLAGLDSDPRYRFVKGDIADAELFSRLWQEEGGLDAIINFAAESHVDRSIEDPGVFLRTNVLGTQILLNATRQRISESGKPCRFVQVSTDEVYGSLGPTGSFTEDTPVSPRSPYSASKTGADHLVQAYHHTYGFDAVITRCSNNYGPYQFPEKLIPLMILNASQGKELPVYGDGMQVRDWLHVADHCRAIALALAKGKPGEVYNVGGGTEMPNIELVRLLLKELDRPETLIRHVADRPGHDRRYSIDSSKSQRELGWSPQVPFTEGLAATVRWYLDHANWVQKVTSGEYRKFYEINYGSRLSS